MVQAGTYWHVLILTIQSGYAALLLDLLLQFCPADSIVLETTASNHTNASSRMFQSTSAGSASNLVTSPALIGGGRRQRRFFGGSGRFHRRGRRRCTAASAGARWRWRWCRSSQRVRAWDHGWVVHGRSLGDELAGQVLGLWTSPSTGFLEDIVVECGERVTELCRKFVRGAWHQIFHTKISPWFLLIDHR